jgi:hypothetical protein
VGQSRAAEGHKPEKPRQAVPFGEFIREVGLGRRWAAGELSNFEHLMCQYVREQVSPRPLAMPDLPVGARRVPQTGKFDNPNRLFWSFAASWRSVQTRLNDYHEFLPEFFDEPGHFVNHNGFNLGLIDKRSIADVELSQ